MNLSYPPESATRRPVLMFAGEPGLQAALEGLGERSVTRRQERAPTGKLVEAERHPGSGPVVRAVAACAFVAALFALIGAAVELALAL